LGRRARAATGSATRPGGPERLIDAYRATADRYRARCGTTAPLVDAKQRFAALLEPGAIVLDVGCGPGRDLAWFSRAGLQPVGLDPVQEMLTACPEGLPAIVGDVRRLPLAANSIDAWWPSASLLHLTESDLPIALAQLVRVSRSGAVGFLSAKQGDGDEWVVVEGGPHRRYFRYWQADELDQLLKGAGFEVTKRETAEDSLGRRAWLHRIVRC
jgi:ubiquinone/menaquinone biosynthesis C-methylase UbiE